MKFLEIGNLGGNLAGLGIIGLLAGLVTVLISFISVIVIGILSASNKDKKYNFKPSLIGILVGVCLLIAGGSICGFNL